MKKLLLLFLLLILVTLVACGGGAVTSPDVTDAPLPENTLSADGVFTVLREGDGLTVSVTLAEAKNESVSILLLKDLDHLYTWSEDPESRLVNLSEIRLDGEGKGSAFLGCTEASVFVVLTATSGCYIEEVK